MLAVHNSVAFTLGNILHGNAEGPLGVSALLLITAMLLIWLIAILRGTG
jgi:hypothetical protein